MNAIRSVSSALLGAALAACSPLQQAPLVYSSKVTVGIDVSANVAESQGGSINIGVRSIDSAYVPVAVSKELDKNAKVSEGTRGLERIEARYGAGTSAETTDDTTAGERNRKIEAYFAAKQAADAAATALAAAENQLSLVGTQLTQIQTLRSGVVAASAARAAAAAASAVGTPSTQVPDAYKQRADDIAKLNLDQKTSIPVLKLADDGKDNAADVLKSIDERIAALTTARSTMEAGLPNLKAQRQAAGDESARAKDAAVRVAGLSQTSKTDAMSVYGRFDANTGASTEKGAGASVLVGKVFSTGLASQNLTEAVMLEATARCLNSGLELAKSMTDDAGRKAIIDGLAKLCPSQAGSTRAK